MTTKEEHNESGIFRGKQQQQRERRFAVLPIRWRGDLLLEIDASGAGQTIVHWSDMGERTRVRSAAYAADHKEAAAEIPRCGGQKCSAIHAARSQQDPRGGVMVESCLHTSAEKSRATRNTGRSF